MARWSTSKLSAGNGGNHATQHTLVILSKLWNCLSLSLSWEICILTKLELRISQVNLMKVDFLLEGMPLYMKVDTGACVSLVPKQMFQSLFPGQTLRPLKAQL